MYVTVGKNVKKIRESTQHSTIFVWYIIHEKKYWHYAEQCKKGFGNFHISFFVSGFFMILKLLYQFKFQSVTLIYVKIRQTKLHFKLRNTASAQSMYYTRKV